MLVKSISDYLTVNEYCLHIDNMNGCFWGEMYDVNTALISIKEDKFSDDEINTLLECEIEFGVVEKGDLIIPLFKIGPDHNPFVYLAPIDPSNPVNNEIIDRFIENRLITFCIAEGKEDNVIIKGLRILGIPDIIRDYVANKWINSLERGGNVFMKYINFVNNVSQENTDLLKLWNKCKKLGSFEE